MGFRRGFKTEANHLARELREELHLLSHEPLCPWTLAKSLEIPVVQLTDLRQTVPEAVHCLSGKEKNSFSAVTVFDGNKGCIVYNDCHHPYRQASSISHEISHSLLRHPPTPPLNEYGFRYYNKEIEEEADWLGFALLISQEAALHIAESGMSISAATQYYGVSKKVINMRINVTGARKRVERARKGK